MDDFGDKPAALKRTLSSTGFTDTTWSTVQKYSLQATIVTTFILLPEKQASIFG